MLYINKITNSASQKLTLTGIPGIQITVTLEYMPRIQQWIMGFNDGTTNVQGITITCGVNILRQWKNNIIFGISCLRNDGLDPYQISDFSDQVANLYLLNAAEVAQVEAEWFT